MCQPQVSMKFAVMKIARAIPAGSNAVITSRITMEIPCTMNESMRIARKRLPAPAGSRRMCTCSGVTISSSRFIDASQEQPGHQADEQQDRDRDLHRVRE